MNVRTLFTFAGILADVGLGKFQLYISNWGIIWGVEAYKKKLPEIEAKQKR